MVSEVACPRRTHRAVRPARGDALRPVVGAAGGERAEARSVTSRSRALQAWAEPRPPCTTRRGPYDDVTRDPLVVAGGGHLDGEQPPVPLRAGSAGNERRGIRIPVGRDDQAPAILDMIRQPGPPCRVLGERVHRRDRVHATELLDGAGHHERDECGTHGSHRERDERRARDSIQQVARPICPGSPTRRAIRLRDVQRRQRGCELHRPMYYELRTAGVRPQCLRHHRRFRAAPRKWSSTAALARNDLLDMLRVRSRGGADLKLANSPTDRGSRKRGQALSRPAPFQV